jgi:putative membrane protein insertion efficiency factor
VRGRARSVAWSLGVPARLALIGLIRLYRLLLSGWLGGQCRFYPSCSRYAEESVREHGALKGSALAVWRVARCGPFTKGGVDPVPPGLHHALREHEEYDDAALRGAA